MITCRRKFYVLGFSVGVFLYLVALFYITILKTYSGKPEWPITNQTRNYAIRDVETFINEQTRDGRPSGVQQIVVVTTWRSGSTFLSELLNAVPAAYQHYEPLMQFQFVDLNDPVLKPKAVAMVENLLSCRYQHLNDYIDFARGTEEMMRRNVNLWRICERYGRDLCYDQIFLNRSCALFPLQVMKTVRLPVASTRQLILKEHLNLKVIFLVRDPRGTIASRKRMVWCDVPACSSPVRLCQNIDRNLEAALSIMEDHPDRLTILRYEDMASNPMEVSKSLLKWLGLPWSRDVERFVIRHTSRSVDNPWSTIRLKGSRIAVWMSTLTRDEIDSVQDACSQTMDRLGYIRVDQLSNETQTFTTFPMYYA